MTTKQDSQLTLMDMQRMIDAMETALELNQKLMNWSEAGDTENLGELEKILQNNKEMWERLKKAFAARLEQIVRAHHVATEMEIVPLEAAELEMLRVEMATDPETFLEKVRDMLDVLRTNVGSFDVWSDIDPCFVFVTRVLSPDEPLKEDVMKSLEENHWEHIQYYRILMECLVEEPEETATASQESLEG